MIIFYLVRHGEAENNVRHILNSLPEIKKYHLTELGRKQVSEAAEFLATANADVIISSPIRRAQETAEIISLATEVPIVFDERLCESGMGVFNEKSREELLAKYPDAEMRISTDTEDGVENFIDMRGRMKHFLDSVKEKYVGKKVIVVSHSDPLEQLHGILTNESPGQSALGWHPSKGSCTEVVWER